jgi:hypothetical protein
MIFGLIPQRLGSHPACFLWCEQEPLPPCHSLIYAPSALLIDCSMPRPRGKPRRGAPWRPRRPSLSSPDTSSDDSQPSLQIASSPVNLQPPHFGSMAIIPTSSTTLHRLHPDPGPSQPPASNLGHGQTSPSQFSPPATGSPAPFDKAQLRDNLATLYTLVFELRQEVADLHFRVEVTEIKVADCLQILASLRDALFPNSDAEAEDEDPGVEGDGVLHPETSTSGKRKEEEMQEDSATAAVRTQEQDEPGHYEHEPVDPPATWPTYQPGV